MPEMMAFTGDGQFPNSNELEGYDTLEIVEPDTSIWSKMVPPKKLSIYLDGVEVGNLSLGRDGTGIYKFCKSIYGVTLRSTSSESDRDETYFLEAFDIEFERTLCRSMAHGAVSVVSIAGIEVQRSLIGKEQTQAVLMSKAASVAKAPIWKEDDVERKLMARVFVRKEAEELDLLILNSLLLSDRATWHSIVARETLK